MKQRRRRSKDWLRDSGGCEAAPRPKPAPRAFGPAGSASGTSSATLTEKQGGRIDERAKRTAGRSARNVGTEPLARDRIEPKRRPSAQAPPSDRRSGRMAFGLRHCLVRAGSERPKAGALMKSSFGWRRALQPAPFTTLTEKQGGACAAAKAARAAGRGAIRRTAGLWPDRLRRRASAFQVSLPIRLRSASDRRNDASPSLR